MPDMKGKVALVTGAGSGIGRASALAFARAGATVVGADFDEQGGQDTVKMITDAGGEASFVKCDVSQADQVKALIDGVVEKYGRIDCAHNNAGISGNMVPLADGTLENWDKVIGVNLSGIFYCCKYEIEHMLNQGGGGDREHVVGRGSRRLPERPRLCRSHRHSKDMRPVGDPHARNAVSDNVHYDIPARGEQDWWGLADGLRESVYGSPVSG